jgi:hypothetical protein
MVLQAVEATATAPTNKIALLPTKSIITLQIQHHIHTANQIPPNSNNEEMILPLLPNPNQ